MVVAALIPEIPFMVPPKLVFRNFHEDEDADDVDDDCGATGKQNLLQSIEQSFIEYPSLLLLLLANSWEGLKLANDSVMSRKIRSTLHLSLLLLDEVDTLCCALLLLLLIIVHSCMLYLSTVVATRLVAIAR